MIMNKSYVPTGTFDKKKVKWAVVDASGEVLGRLATKIAMMIRGKDKPTFTPHADTGVCVVVINAEKIVLTGDKWSQKVYVRHSMYPGGRKEVVAKDMLKKFPERIIEHAVFGMLPKGNLGHSLKGKLKVYAGEHHPHQAQLA